MVDAVNIIDAKLVEVLRNEDEVKDPSSSIIYEGIIFLIKTIGSILEFHMRIELEQPNSTLL